MIQGWKVTDDDTISEITVTNPIPGHETVIRLPARMAPFLLEVVRPGKSGGLYICELLISLADSSAW